MTIILQQILVNGKDDGDIYLLLSGNSEMIAEAAMYLNLPKNTTKKQEFIDLIYITQVSFNALPDDKF